MRGAPPLLLLTLLLGSAAVAWCEVLAFTAVPREAADGTRESAWYPGSAPSAARCVEASLATPSRVRAYTLVLSGTLRAWNASAGGVLVDRRSFRAPVARGRPVRVRVRSPLIAATFSVCSTDPTDTVGLAELALDGDAVGPAPSDSDRIRVAAGCDGVPGSGATYDLEGVCGGPSRDGSRPVPARNLSSLPALAIDARPASSASLYVRFDAPVEDPWTHPIATFGGASLAAAADGSLYLSGVPMQPCALAPGRWARVDLADGAAPRVDGVACPRAGTVRFDASLPSSVGGAGAPFGLFALVRVDGAAPLDLGPSAAARSIGPLRDALEPPVDACGVPGGNGTSCPDCFGVPFGPAARDLCGRCGGNSSDCWGCDGRGSAVDACGVCGGDGTSCRPCAWVDACGVCNGRNETCAGCDGIVGSARRWDACGVCGGNGTSCLDCRGAPLGGAVRDACGDCGGSLACAGCDGVPRSNAKFDAWGRCSSSYDAGSAPCPQEVRPAAACGVPAGYVRGSVLGLGAGPSYNACAKACAAARANATGPGCYAAAYDPGNATCTAYLPAIPSAPPPDCGGVPDGRHWYLVRGAASYCDRVGCDGLWGSERVWYRNASAPGGWSCGRDPGPAAAPVPGGCDGEGSAYDACGVCGGPFVGGLACEAAPVALPAPPAPLGPCANRAPRDACGVCGGAASGTCPAGTCDGVSGSGRHWDACGACGGDNSTCTGCDGVLLSGRSRDACGVCGGDGTTCSDCRGVPAGGATIDRCGVCGGDGTSCLGCDGVVGSGLVWDRYGTCNGTEFARRVVADRCGVRGGDHSSCAPTLSGALLLPDPRSAAWTALFWLRAPRGAAFGVLTSAVEDQALGCAPARGAWLEVDAAGSPQLGAAGTPGVEGRASAPLDLGGRWSHVAVAFSPANGTVLYVNGSVVASIGALDGLAAAAAAPALGLRGPCSAATPAADLPEPPLFSDVRLLATAADEARVRREMILLPPAQQPPYAGYVAFVYPSPGSLLNGTVRNDGGAAGAPARLAVVRGAAGSLPEPILPTHRAAANLTREEADAEVRPGCAYPVSRCGACGGSDEDCPRDCEGVILGPAVRGPCGRCECESEASPPPPPGYPTVLDPCTLARVRPADAYACVRPDSARLLPLRPLSLPVPPARSLADGIGLEAWFDASGAGEDFTIAIDGGSVAASLVRAGAPGRFAFQARDALESEVRSGTFSASGWTRVALSIVGERVSASLGGFPWCEADGSSCGSVSLPVDWSDATVRSATLAGAELSGVRLFAGAVPSLGVPTADAAPSWAFWPLTDGHGRSARDASGAGRHLPLPYRRWVVSGPARPAPLAFPNHRPACDGSWPAAGAASSSVPRDACGACRGDNSTCGAVAFDAGELGIVRDIRFAGNATSFEVPGAEPSACAAALAATASERADPTFLGATHDSFRGVCALHRAAPVPRGARPSAADLERSVGFTFVARRARDLPPLPPVSPAAPAPTPPPFPCPSWVEGVCIQAPDETSPRVEPARGAPGRYSRMALVPVPPFSRGGGGAVCADLARARGARWAAYQGSACWVLPSFDAAALGGPGYDGGDAVDVVDARADSPGSLPALVFSEPAPRVRAYEVSYGACGGEACPSPNATAWACSPRCVRRRARPVLPADGAPARPAPNGTYSDAYAEHAPGRFTAVICSGVPCYDPHNRGNRFACVEGRCVAAPAPPAEGVDFDFRRAGLLPPGVEWWGQPAPSGSHRVRIEGQTAAARSAAWCLVSDPSDPRGSPALPRLSPAACPADGRQYACTGSAGACAPTGARIVETLDPRPALPEYARAGPDPETVAPAPARPGEGGVYAPATRLVRGVEVPSRTAAACDDPDTPGLPSVACPPAAADGFVRACPGCSVAAPLVVEPAVRHANVWRACPSGSCAVACYAERPGTTTGALAFEICNADHPRGSACNVGGGCALREPAPDLGPLLRDPAGLRGAPGAAYRDIPQADGSAFAHRRLPSAAECPSSERSPSLGAELNFTSYCPLDGWSYRCNGTRVGCVKEAPAWRVRETECTLEGGARAYLDPCGRCNGVGYDACGTCAFSALECLPRAGTVAARLFGPSIDLARVSRAANVTAARLRLTPEAAAGSAIVWIADDPADPAADVFGRLWAATSVPSQPSFSLDLVGAHRLGETASTASARRILAVPAEEVAPVVTPTPTPAAPPAGGGGLSWPPPLPYLAAGGAGAAAALALVSLLLYRICRRAPATERAPARRRRRAADDDS